MFNIFGAKKHQEDSTASAASPRQSLETPQQPGQARTSMSAANAGGQQGSSDVFIKLALEQLQNAKESRKLTNLKDACKSALEVLDSPSARGNMDSQSLRTVFSPFQLACRTRQPVLATIAIDCLGKLFTYNYWGKHEVTLEGDFGVGGR
ncbi:hypothetical protein BC832DRAFT_588643 [Gaertneriomyces semiglobifer]|nr:hypothetical protein BC832DRAFT_588643 [Gaertneriomyces semiglobifer]